MNWKTSLSRGTSPGASGSRHNFTLSILRVRPWRMDFFVDSRPVKGPKKKPNYTTNSWTLSDFFRKTKMYVGLFVGHSISIFVFGESWCVDVLLSFRCISENMCGAEIHGFFYYRLHFPSRKASIQNKMRNSTCVESSLQPTFPFNILHFPRCLFWCRKKGCSSTPFHPFFGPKWHAKCVLAADVGQIVNSLWHLAAGLSSGDVWGELPHKKQKTSEFETHLFRLLKL